MVSIPSAAPEMLGDEEEIATFHHALKVSVYEIHDMSREQLLQLCLEQHALIVLITSIVYNVYAKATTRILALDVIFTAARRVGRRTMANMFDFMPIELERVGEKVGISKNTVQTAYTSLTLCGAIRKNPRTDENGHKHLDIAISSVLLNNPACIEDATEEAKIQRREKRKCVKCGSERVDTYRANFCKDCGYTHFEELDIDRSDIGGQCLEFVPVSSQEATASVTEVEAPIVPSEIEPDKNASESVIVAIMQHYGVQHLDYMTCHCGCKLFWKSLGEWCCARCEPGNLWPDNYVAAIKAVYPGSKVVRSEVRT